MAPTGVVNSNQNSATNSGRNRRGARGAGGGLQPKNPKQRMLLYGGLGIGGILLLSRHGSQGSTGPDPNAGLADALAAQQAAQGLAPPTAPDPALSTPPSAGDGSGGGGGGGGGSTGDYSGTTNSDNVTGSDNTTTNTTTTNIRGGVNVNVPGGGKGGKGKKPPHKPVPTSRGGVGRVTGKMPIGRGKGGGPAPVRRRGAPHPSGAPKPRSAPRGRPAPANKGGGHPNTPHKTGYGTARKSPALVESIFGAGSGIVVMGRQFPGAISHRLGAPRRNVDGSIDRTVTVDYGGRTETHICHGNGDYWTDRAPGLNPPSRGVPLLTNNVPA